MTLTRNFSNGDIVTNGSDQLADGERATMLSVIYRLRMVRGEDFLNVTNGTPWFDGILGHVNKEDAASLIRQQILLTPAVLGVSEFDFDYDRITHKYTVNATVVSDRGTTVPIMYSGEVF